MIHIAICDDESVFRKKERIIIQKYLNEKNINSQIYAYDSGDAFLRSFQTRLKYDMVFLDISMKNTNGIETAEKLRILDKDIKIVFVTAFFKYINEGYKVNAYRFIIKDSDTLEEAICEAINDYLIEKDYKDQIIRLKFCDGTKDIFVEDIIYIESQLHKLIFHMRNENKLFMSEKLDNVEHIFPENLFVRVHKSYMVNLMYVDKIQRFEFILVQGEKISIAKPKYPEIKEEYLLYRGFI